MTEEIQRQDTVPDEEPRGWRALFGALRSRRLAYGTNTLVACALALALLGLVDALAARHSFRLDLTAGKRYTLAPQSVKVVKALAEPVKVTAFFGEVQPGRRTFKELMGQYAYHSPKLTYEVIDPDRQPALARRYKVSSYGTIVAERKDREERFFDVSEEAVTNALVKVSRSERKKVYFLTGHGEHGLDDAGKNGYSAVKEALESENYEVKPLLLLRAEAVPADASVVVVAGPTADLLPPEVKLLETHVKRGGKFLVLVDPGEVPALAAFLKEKGIELVADTLIDRMSRIFGADARMPVVSQYTSHPITKEFAMASFFPLARSVRPLNDPPEGVDVQALASTGSGSWAETDLVALDKGQAAFDEKKDIGGPVPVAAVATIVAEAKESGSASVGSTPSKTDSARLVVFGDSDFASNTHLNLSGNATLFLNTVSWLAEEEDLIAIRPRSEGSRPMLLSPLQARLLFWIGVVAMPFLVAVVGGSVLWRRRAYR